MSRAQRRASRRRVAGALAAALAAAVLVGCVERRIVITSDPSGALVELNGVDVGVTPLEVDFTYYGVYDVYVTRPGYEALRTSADASAPWYEWPGIDIVSQALPPTERTTIRWHFDLQEQQADAAGLLERARTAKGAFDASAPGTGPGDGEEAAPN